MNIGEWVRKWASIRPDKIAIICEETALTYGQLASRVNRLANLIHKKGIKKGDRVAVLLYNSKEYVEIVLALSTTGAIVCWSHHLLFAVVTCVPRRRRHPTSGDWMRTVEWRKRSAKRLILGV